MSLSLVLPLNIQGMGLQSFDDSEVSEAIKQNLRMLLLTAPGEYVMSPDFGVGLRNYLFELGTPEIGTRIKLNIEKQCKVFMPYIQINNIEINLDSIDSNVLGITLAYSTSDSVLDEILELSISA